MSDVERELGLDREALVRLAMLLGSDYTEGCQGAPLGARGRARGGCGCSPAVVWWAPRGGGRMRLLQMRPSACAH